MYDQDAEWAITLVTLSPVEVHSWFGALCATQERRDVATWDDFKDAFRRNAPQWDPSFTPDVVDQFTRELEGSVSDPFQVIARLAENGVEDLVKVYPALFQQKIQAIFPYSADTTPSSAGPTQDVSSLDWVTDEQRDGLHTALGDTWRQRLTNDLTAIWPEWTESTPQDLASWLDAWLPNLTAPERRTAEGTTYYWDRLTRSWLEEPADTTPSSVGPTQDVSSLDWVTDEQRDGLHTALGDTWRQRLTNDLTAIWPEWTEFTPQDLASWLDAWLPNLTAPERRTAEGTTYYWDRLTRSWLEELADISPIAPATRYSEMRDRMAQLLDQASMEALGISAEGLPEDYRNQVIREEMAKLRAEKRNRNPSTGRESASS